MLIKGFFSIYSFCQFLQSHIQFMHLSLERDGEPRYSNSETISALELYIELFSGFIIALISLQINGSEP